MHYILTIDAGVQAETVGPFVTRSARDAEAKRIAASAEFNRDYDSIFRMDIQNGLPNVESYAFDELDEDAETIIFRSSA